ncbi:hypothetical protein Acr_00g0077830 [Actinidia rufa]|uniref:Retrotransposon gag domain-containing protein n=1 Tax=Actinidia rufa TaxID=165716 RepID=A0A7J0DVT5_9ERIC|nr:hypothetical protein Acr_00g0077830 [Actinidia rufa]
MEPKGGRARLVGRGRGGRGATGRGTPIENVGDQGVASQTQQGVDRGVTSHGRRKQQETGRGNPTPVVPEAHSGAGGRETTPDVLVIPSQFSRELPTAMLEIERTRHEEIRIQREVTSARFREGMKEFCKINRPSFDGLGDPVVAGHWLFQIRKIFDTVRIIEDDMKVSFTSYQLVGEANEWWESIKEAKGVDRGMTWADFESSFEDQYIPEAYHDEFRDQFEKLIQGDMMVSEYAIKFQSLSRFAPNLVNTESKKCKRVEPKKEQRKEFKGSWEPRQMSVGTSFTTSGSFSKKRSRDSTQGSVGQQMFGASILALSPNPRKANVVADALSRKVLGKLAEVASLAIREWKMMGEIREFNVDLVDSIGRRHFMGKEVSPCRGLKRFSRGGKLSPRYIGPFDIIAKIGEVAYRLALPPQLSGVHEIFHVSMLRKYDPDPSHVLEWRDLTLEADVSYIERPIRILDTLEHVLRGRSIPMVKVVTRAPMRMESNSTSNGKLTMSMVMDALFNEEARRREMGMTDYSESHALVSEKSRERGRGQGRGHHRGIRKGRLRSQTRGCTLVQFRMADGRFVTLTEVRHVPNLRKNLISIGMLDSKGCSFDASGGTLRVFKGNKDMLWGKKTGGLYRLDGSVQIGGAIVRHGFSGFSEKNGQGKQLLHRGTQSKHRGTWMIRNGT